MDKIKRTFFWKVVLRIYMIYALILFIITFTINLPMFFLCDIFNWNTAALRINHYWAHVFFFLIGLPIRIEQKAKLDQKSQYIFCPNHFSYLDIAILPFVPVPFRYVGKISISKVPFFGYMFKRFHITVDRSNLRERYATYAQSIKAIEEGHSLAIFPEGGIKSKRIPQMHPFKEGAFRMAVETNTPVVPVTLVDNWHILPDDKKFNFKRRKCRVIIHEPISPSDYNMDTLNSFQDHVANIIQSDLDRIHG